MDLTSIVQYSKNPNIPDFRPGDTIRVYARVVEGDRVRVQPFEGVVIRMRRRGISSTFTVRRVSHGVGIERTFPLYSPLIEKVELIRVGRVRRAKLYYLRARIGKAARIRAGSRQRFEELMAAQQRAVRAAEEAARAEEAEPPVEPEEPEAEEPEGEEPSPEGEESSQEEEEE